MMTIHVSLPITRRKQYHAVQDEAEEFIFYTMNTAELFEWLAQSGERDFLLNTGEGEYLLSVNPKPQHGA